MLVVAAIIEQDGRFLICQRRKEAAFALQWEFPGGKVKSDETPQAALSRELQEELGVQTTIGAELFQARHQYSEYAETVELHFFAAELNGQTPQNLAFQQMIWAAPHELPQYDFLAGDREIVARLARGLDSRSVGC
jgi:mutator protein MutT